MNKETPEVFEKTQILPQLFSISPRKTIKENFFKALNIKPVQAKEEFVEEESPPNYVGNWDDVFAQEMKANYHLWCWDNKVMPKYIPPYLRIRIKKNIPKSQFLLIYFDFNLKTQNLITVI